MKICTGLFTNFEIQEKISLGNLDLFPIKAQLQKAPVNIKTFAELAETGHVFITEVGEDGNVELVSVKNLSDSYVFIADGEALIGAKQNRIAQLSALIPPQSSIDLPVNCVERSRWSPGMNGNFRRGNFALPPSAREKKSSLLKSKLNMHIQSSVWTSVDEVAHRHNSFSETSDLGQIIEASPHIAKSLDHFEHTEIDCNGFVVFGTGRPFVELFFDGDVCKAHQAANWRAWLADASEKKDHDINKTDAIALLEKLTSSDWENEDPVGYETAFSAEEKSLGRMILKEDAFVHGYFFS